MRLRQARRAHMCSHLSRDRTPLPRLRVQLLEPVEVHVVSGLASVKDSAAPAGTQRRAQLSARVHLVWLPCAAVIFPRPSLRRVGTRSTDPPLKATRCVHLQHLIQVNGILSSTLCQWRVTRTPARWRYV
eukprot:6209664-Pleurochrysis_carterae.AAC.3